jgi:hypothetical protein
MPRSLSGLKGSIRSSIQVLRVRGRLSDAAMLEGGRFSFQQEPYVGTASAAI